MVYDALLLPEVVAAILNAGSEETGLLYNCLLVNQLFLVEARRILWSKCDSSTGVHPNIEDLGAMVLRDDIGPKRAQIYANVVRELCFHYDNGYVDQTSWHAVLCQLQFPQLASVCFWETDHGTTLNTEDVILHYAKSNLRQLSVDACGPLSEKFFDSMAGICSKLDSLILHPSKVTAPSSYIVRMLERMPNIDSLDLEKGFETMFSSEMLKVIACFPALDQAVLPYVQDDYLLAVQTLTNTHCFPKLRYLYVGATAESLRLYYCIAPEISALGLSNDKLERTDHVLASASLFKRLTSFTAQLSTSTTIQADELIQLAQGCPMLEEIKIGMDSYSVSKPSGVGITDEVIEQLAPYLVCIKVFYLIFDHVDQRGPGCIHTIRTLGHHCKKLQELVLSCEPDWSLINFLPEDEGPLAASLEQLQLLPDVHMMSNLTEGEHHSLLNVWQHNARAWLPQISLLIIPGADDWEEAFVDILCPVDEEEEALEDESVETAIDGPGDASLTTI